MSIFNDITTTIKIQEGTYTPAPWDTVTGIIQGDKYLDIVCMQKPVYGHVSRIDKDHYINRFTGEIKEYQHNPSSQLRDYMNLKRTFQRLRRLLRTNFEGTDNEAFLTLTYRENVRDPTKLYKDYEKFIKKLRYNYPEMDIEYIAVAEPQSRGSWHLHITIKNTAGKFWINQSVLRKLWGHGGAYIERIKNGDIGSYYVAYFTDLLNATEDKHAHDETLTAEQKSKARIKGGRLELYPKNFKFYRCSRGIKDPEKNDFVFDGIDDEFECIWSRSVEVIKTNGEQSEVLNRIHKATYKKRKDGEK